jgi:hypothetical protein
MTYSHPSAVVVARDDQPFAARTSDWASVGHRCHRRGLRVAGRCDAPGPPGPISDRSRQSRQRPTGSRSRCCTKQGMARSSSLDRGSGVAAVSAASACSSASAVHNSTSAAPTAGARTQLVVAAHQTDIEFVPLPGRRTGSPPARSESATGSSVGTTSSKLRGSSGATTKTARCRSLSTSCATA